MGEYALRKVDHKEVKIGTLENMYYMTLPQLFDVEALNGNVDPVRDLEKLWFRPHILGEEFDVGDYDNCEVDADILRTEFEFSDEDKEAIKQNPGKVHLEVKDKLSTGYFITIDCHHGFDTPVKTDSYSTNYNGRWSSIFYIRAIGVRNREIKFLVSCGSCGKSFVVDYEDFLKSLIYSPSRYPSAYTGLAQKVYINNAIYYLKCGYYGKLWRKLIDFDKITLLDIDKCYGE